MMRNIATALNTQPMCETHGANVTATWSRGIKIRLRDLGVRSGEFCVCKLIVPTNGMGNDPFVDYRGEWVLVALGYTQPLQHFTSHLVTHSKLAHSTNK